MPQTFSNENSVYSVDMMFAYLKNNKHPVTKLKVDEYIHVLDYPGWGNPANNISYSALDVIKHPKKYQADYKRIMKADLSYPIILSFDGFIVDGVHRISKAYLEERKEINAYVFDEELMEKFKIANKSKDVWKIIAKMPVYEIISLYNERFCKN